MVQDKNKEKEERDDPFQLVQSVLTTSKSNIYTQL